MNATGWGGYREGSGRKPNGYPESPERKDFEAERALHEKVKREQREFKLAQERGEYLPRAAVRQASATAVALLSQALQSLPDNLERACNLTPEQAETAQRIVDAAMHELSIGMKALAGE